MRPGRYHSIDRIARRRTAEAEHHPGPDLTAARLPAFDIGKVAFSTAAHDLAHAHRIELAAAGPAVQWGGAQ